MNRSDDQPLPRIPRRVALKWIAGASASLTISGSPNFSPAATKTIPAVGYGRDPDILKQYQPGELWPLTFTDAQRQLVITLCDIIIPADDTSPSASQVGVHDFVDEWISSPYQEQNKDRNLILRGLAWLDEEAPRHDPNAETFVALNPKTRLAICSELAVAAKNDRKEYPGSFFYLLRNLVAGGYFTTPEGMKVVGYAGNTPNPIWNGPPKEVLDKLGLSPQE
ncbi:MAG: gluconate 2-dehydrogenase subunit 3 family protein [Verrucomicrobiota bacterium]